MRERGYSFFPKKPKAAGQAWESVDTAFSQKGRGGGAGMRERRYSLFPKKVKWRGVAIEYAGRVGENIK